jgi:hypothetical protein
VQRVLPGVVDAEAFQYYMIMDGGRFARIGNQDDERLLQRAHPLSHAGSYSIVALLCR